MLVFGDQIRTESPYEKLLHLDGALRQLVTTPPGIERHAELVGAFIEAGELAQGIADKHFSKVGCDARSEAADAAITLLTRIALAVRVSWESGFARVLRVPEQEIRALRAVPLPDEIECKRAEGFALHSLYPESYLQAAAALDPGRPTRVVGIRSIGVPLAALVAAAVKAPPPVTLRPLGHPYFRKVAVAGELAAELVADPTARFAIVDEGPGLSGSSFGAVADFLEDHGVAPDRIDFFPSHWRALGQRASRRHCERWAWATRHVVDPTELLLHAPRRPEHRLDSWAADLVGRPEGPLKEISGGHWRALRYARKSDWPAARIHMERRKFLLRAGSGTWLLKFVGLGREGARKLDRAQALSAAGFCPAVAGWRHGFLIEQWIGDARPLDPALVDRDRLVRHVGRYLGFRAKHFAADPGRGASLATLWRMARFNAGQALGEDLARRLDHWAPDLDRLERRVRRIETDSRLHAWEWLLARDGRLLKTDALDHHAGHDLVGCQDIAWDVAGAVAELGFSGPERDQLCRVVEGETGRAVDPELLALLWPCYLAFQLGDHTMSAEAASEDGAEADRLRGAAECYALRLRDVLLAGA